MQTRLAGLAAAYSAGLASVPRRERRPTQSTNYSLSRSTAGAVTKISLIWLIARVRFLIAERSDLRYLCFGMNGELCHNPVMSSFQTSFPAIFDVLGPREYAVPFRPPHRLGYRR